MKTNECSNLIRSVRLAHLKNIVASTFERMFSSGFLHILGDKTIQHSQQMIFAVALSQMSDNTTKIIKQRPPLVPLVLDCAVDIDMRGR